MCLPMLAAGAIGYKQFENSKKKNTPNTETSRIGVTEKSAGGLPGPAKTDLTQKR